MKAGTPILVALTFLLLAAPAGAQQWVDQNEGTMAQDVGAVAAGWTGDGSLGIAMSFYNRLWGAGDRLNLYIDADANRATGDPGGAEYGVFYEQYGDGSATLYGVWQGTGFAIVPAGLRPVVEMGGWAILLPPHLIGAPAGPVAFRVSTRYLPAAIAFDHAPDTGSYLVPARTAVGGATGPAAPVAPGAAAPPAAPAVPTPASQSPSARAARAAVRRAFRRRNVRLTSTRCRARSAARSTCAVTGRRGRWRYRGTATVGQSAAGVSVLVRGTRRRAGCARCASRRFTWRR
jgi:hypothetical protein